MGTIWSSLFRPQKASEPKVILITGASAGMGKDMALTMIRRGHIVYGGARRVEKMQDLVELGGHALALDVTDPQQTKQAVDRILQEQGRIDVLVNNAGFAIKGAVEDIPLQRTHDLFQVNFFGIVDLTRQVLPHMRKAKKGRIVNVSSALGQVYNVFSSSYVATKHALEGWSDCLRVEAALFNVQVAILQPGSISTEFFEAHEFVQPKDSAYKQYMEGYVHDYFAKLVPRASHPSVVTEALIHATESHRPKRRYAMGYLAKTSILFRNWVGDGAMDWLFRFVFASFLKNDNNNNTTTKKIKAQ